MRIARWPSHLSVATACTATFNLTPVTYSLTVTKVGPGTGTVNQHAGRYRLRGGLQRGLRQPARR